MSLSGRVPAWAPRLGNNALCIKSKTALDSFCGHFLLLFSFCCLFESELWGRSVTSAALRAFVTIQHSSRETFSWPRGQCLDSHVCQLSENTIQSPQLAATSFRLVRGAQQSGVSFSILHCNPADQTRTFHQVYCLSQPEVEDLSNAASQF